MEISENSITPISLVSFRIFGKELDPIVVTDILKLTPQKIYSKGHYITNTNTIHEESMWILSSSLENHAPFIEHIAHILYVLEPKQESILWLSKRYTVDFYCTLFAQNGFHLSRNVIQRIVNLGADLQVTIYP